MGVLLLTLISFTAVLFMVLAVLCGACFGYTHDRGVEPDLKWAGLASGAILIASALWCLHSYLLDVLK